MNLSYINVLRLNVCNNGLECIVRESRGSNEALKGTDAERKFGGRVSGGDVHRIHGWHGAFERDGYRRFAESTGPHQGL